MAAPGPERPSRRGVGAGRMPAPLVRASSFSGRHGWNFKDLDAVVRVLKNLWTKRYKKKQNSLNK
jgi:hypothetical protein